MHDSAAPPSAADSPAEPTAPRYTSLVYELSVTPTTSPLEQIQALVKSGKISDATRVKVPGIVDAWTPFGSCKKLLGLDPDANEDESSSILESSGIPPNGTRKWQLNNGAHGMCIKGARGKRWAAHELELLCGDEAAKRAVRSLTQNTCMSACCDVLRPWRAIWLPRTRQTIVRGWHRGRVCTGSSHRTCPHRRGSPPISQSC